MDNNDTKNSYHCTKCIFTATKKSNWNIHIKTKKHITNINDNKSILKSVVIENGVTKEKYSCLCGSTYMHITSIYKHQKKCKKYNEKLEMEKSIKYEIIPTSIIITNEMIMEFMQEIKDQQNILLEQNLELKQKLLELSNK